MKLYLRATLCLLLITVGGMTFGQEVVQSQAEQYHDFLALIGREVRPYLNYRTLSDSRWKGDTGAPWSGLDIGSVHSIAKNVRYKLYGPEYFSSYNSDEPYGQNDGELWQGRGFNASLSLGARIEAFGFELTIKPSISFSQNLPFALLPSAYDSPYGYYWGNSKDVGVDAPQRFGDQPFFDYSFGDSEARFSWKSLTVGVGTQQPWIGPGRINSIIQSNNSPPYPKADIGIRKTSVNIADWNLGEVEGRLWLGALHESAYFDNDPTNNQNLISGLALAYAPSFLPGLSLSLNRTFLAKWGLDGLGTIPTLLLFKFNNTGGGDSWDQRISLGFDYLLPSAGVEVYGEAGINDNPGPTLDSVIRNFSHTVVYTGGIRKAVVTTIPIPIEGELLFEWSNLEMSPVYSQFLWANSFYMHGQITQGYTNEGQWLGAGTGTGGNSQYLGYTAYFPRGSASFYLHRYNPDNDFLLRFTTPVVDYPTDNIYGVNFKAVLAIGVSVAYFVTTNTSASAGAAYVEISDPLYSGTWESSTKLNGFRLEFSINQYI